MTISMTAATFACLGFAQEPVKLGLDMYEGKNLRKLDQRGDDEFQQRLERLTGDKPEKREWGAMRPWSVSKFQSPWTAWILVEAYPGYEVPDVSGMQLHAFDKDWKRICKMTFPTGYRFFLTDVRIERNPELRQDLVVARTKCSGPFVVTKEGQTPAFEQGSFQSQYYAFVGSRFELVRLEDDKKRLAGNSYGSRAPWKGPSPPKRTAKEWIGLLTKGEPAQKLAVLVWLSGGHMPSDQEREENVNQASVEDSKLYETVRDSPETRKALKELADSKLPWTREYAKFTLQGFKLEEEEAQRRKRQDE